MNINIKNTKKQTKSEKNLIKKFDTKISVIEKELSLDLGVRSDMKFGNYLKKIGYPSLSGMLKG